MTLITGAISGKETCLHQNIRNSVLVQEHVARDSLYLRQYISKTVRLRTGESGVRITLGRPPSLFGNGYRVIPGGKRPGRGVNHPLFLAPKLKKVNSYISALPLCLHGKLWAKICLDLRESKSSVRTRLFKNSPFFF